MQYSYSGNIILYIEILLLLLLFITFIISIIALVKYSKLKKTVQILTKDTTGQDIVEIVQDYYKKIETVDKNYDEVINLLKFHDKFIKNSLQKVYIHRYNPYKNLGGNLSWVLCVLDTKNNGYIINNVYHPEGSQAHSREIISGTCSLKLTEDEQICLENTVKLDKI